jgi:hypothetical protein
MTLLGIGAAFPQTLRAQQRSKIHRIAVVHHSASVSEMTETGENPAYRSLF